MDKIQRVQKIMGFSNYEIDMTDFSDVKVFSLNYHNSGYRRQLKPGNCNNHHRYTIVSDEGKQVSFYIHCLMWRQLNKREVPKGYDIHHINFIPNDNRPENLMLLTHSEHMKLHSKILNENGRFGAIKKSCLQFDKEWNIIKEWESGAEACRQYGETIGSCISHKNRVKTAYGFIWMYREEYDDLVKSGKFEQYKKAYFKEPRNKTVVALDMEGNFIGEYSSMNIASKATGVQTSSISEICNHHYGFNTAHGYRFMFKSEYDNISS